MSINYLKAYCAALFYAAAPVQSAVFINEVAFDETGPDWVELYNAGPGTAAVNGWRLDDADAAAGKEIILAFPAVIPEGAFLLVYVDAAGVPDLDLSDGAGVVYSGTATTVSLAASQDELGLYTGVPSSATLADFLAWVTLPPYSSASDQADAAGQWPAGAAVELDDPGHGYTVGRARDGADHDKPADFRFFPRGTPGMSNVPPGSPFAVSLRAEPEVFSPYDRDPAYQSTKLYFRAPGEEALKTIRVLDSRGRTVRTLIDQDRGSAGDLSGLKSGSVVWDGRDDAGAFVPVGIYIATFDASPPGGSAARGRSVVAVGRP